MTQSFSHLVWLGAGTATEPTGLINRAQKVTLFEARESACQLLKQQHKNADVRQVILSVAGENLDFKEYNLAEFSAAREVTGLLKLFPGLKTRLRDRVNSVAIHEAIEQLQLTDNNNVLVVDITDNNFALMQALHQKNLLSLFSEIHIQASNEQLYKGAATIQEITDFLKTHGYVLQQAKNDDPDLPWLTFGLNPLWQQLQATERALAEEKNRHQETKAEIIKLQEQLVTLKGATETAQQAAAEVQKKEARINEINSALAAANKAKQDAEQLLAKAQQELALIKSAPSMTPDANLQAVEQKIQKMFVDQTQQWSKDIVSLKNHINSGLANTAKQFEAFIGIDNYLEKGIKPLSFHGWPISPDIGLHLISLIDTYHFDLIVEFGSGTSTVLMAKALIAKQRIQVTQEQPSTKIVTFEHNSLYHEKTYQALTDNGVNHLVDLVHAPLVDYTYKDGSQYLYYNCGEKLEELSRIFKNRKANVLVLVDGPPGATNKNARFPALPHLLNALPEHTLTIVMDDYNRAEEKEIMELWKGIFTERGIKITFDIIPSEKGLSVLRTG